MDYNNSEELDEFVNQELETLENTEKVQYILEKGKDAVRQKGDFTFEEDEGEKLNQTKIGDKLGVSNYSISDSYREII